ncbi:ubiquinone biosynthesis protein [Salix suchowensis]|nr:ubiquinone biosynthesis protein [Salix suchowensis]
MEAAGPTFIKVRSSPPSSAFNHFAASAMAGSRTDLFPTLLCTRLSMLHSQGKPHDFRYTKEAIENVFQRRFEDVFDEFDESPIGTGAIAQVYRATLKQDLIPPSYLGPRRHHSSKHPAAAAILDNVNQLPPSVPSASVAIKVLHPHVNKTIIAIYASCPSSPTSSHSSLQLDLRHEAENLKEFENHFAPRRVPISFPRPLTVWSTKELLVEEYEHALPLEAFLKNGGGLVTTLDDKNRANFLELFRAIAEFDGYGAGQLMVERCRTPELAIDTELFALKMQNIVLSVKRKTFSLGKIKISDILRDVLKSVREHHVKMEGDFVNTVISILLLEGLAGN